MDKTKSCGFERGCRCSHAGFANAKGTVLCYFKGKCEYQLPKKPILKEKDEI